MYYIDLEEYAPHDEMPRILDDYCGLENTHDNIAKMATGVHRDSPGITDA